MIDNYSQTIIDMTSTLLQKLDLDWNEDFMACSRIMGYCKLLADAGYSKSSAKASAKNSANREDYELVYYEMRDKKGNGLYNNTDISKIKERAYARDTWESPVEIQKVTQVIDSDGVVRQRFITIGDVVNGKFIDSVTQFIGFKGEGK